jgi:hypothetical protein
MQLHLDEISRLPSTTSNSVRVSAGVAPARIRFQGGKNDSNADRPVNH